MNILTEIGLKVIAQEPWHLPKEGLLDFKPSDDPMQLLAQIKGIGAFIRWTKEGDNLHKISHLIGPEPETMYGRIGWQFIRTGTFEKPDTYEVPSATDTTLQGFLEACGSDCVAKHDGIKYATDCIQSFDNWREYKPIGVIDTKGFNYLTEASEPEGSLLNDHKALVGGHTIHFFYCLLGASL